MSHTAVEHFWEIINRYESLLEGNADREIPPCPVDIQLTVPPIKGEETSTHQTNAPSHLQRQELLSRISESIRGCLYCSLSESRSESLPGEGTSEASVMVIDSAPTEEDDSFGQLLSGESGDYIEKWLQSIQVNRKEDCYFTSIVKCMTPGGRDPMADEINSCLAYLQAQVKLVQPKLIITLGASAFSSLLNLPKDPFDPLTLALTEYKFDGIPVIALYHPKTVLDRVDLRRPVWEILKNIKKQLMV